MCFYNIQTITLTYIYKKRDDGREGRKYIRKASTKSISDNGIQNNNNKQYVVPPTHGVRFSRKVFCGKASRGSINFYLLNLL